MSPTRNTHKSKEGERHTTLVFRIRRAKNVVIYNEMNREGPLHDTGINQFRSNELMSSFQSFHKPSTNGLEHVRHASD